MTWRRRNGIVTADGGQVDLVTAFLDENRVLGIVEMRQDAVDTVRITLATSDSGRVATLGEGAEITSGIALEDLGTGLADRVGGEVTFREETWLGSDVDARISDPFEQPLGADIAAFADRAVVFTRAGEQGLTRIASQVDDVIYALGHVDGHALCITEGPILSTLTWDEETRPAIIITRGAATPSVTVIAEGEPHELTWGASEVHTPTGAEGQSGEPFINAFLGTGALVREIMSAFPAIEPATVRTCLGEGMEELLAALGLPAVLVDYLDSEIDAAEIPGAREIHPASFARSVRRVVTEASTSVSEGAEAVRQRAVAVRTRAETAFDAAEAFAEDVVIPVRQNWVSPALAVAETALGVLALRRARRIGGVGGTAVGAGGVLLLGDAVVNAVVSLAPLLRRRNHHGAH